MYSRSTSSLIRLVALAGYYCIASRLPEYALPGGRFGRWLRQACAHRLLTSSGDWINIGPHVTIGRGSQIHLGEGSSIGRDSRVEALIVADAVMIGPELLSLSRNHLFEDSGQPIGWQGASDICAPTIGYGSWVGARVTLLPGVKVGRMCVVGAGAVVTKDVPDYSVAAGNPARVIRTWASPTTPSDSLGPNAGF